MKNVEIYNLYKSFGNNLVLNNLSLTIQEGEIYGLLGPNGAGKSTTINILSGLKNKDKGEIKIFGKTLEENSQEIKAQMGVIPQDLALFEMFNAYDNVSFFGKLYGLRKNELREKTLEALKFVGLEDKKKEKVKTFSGGMKRRLNIACGIVHNPRLIIMDEPTVGIDPQSRNYILNSIKALNKRGATIIYTTHYMEEAEQLCDKIGIVDQGSIIASGTTDQLRSIVSDTHQVQVTVRDVLKVDEEKLKNVKGVEHVSFQENILCISTKREINCLDKVITQLSIDEAEILDIQSKQVTLEDVFLNLTGRKLRD